MNVNLFFSTIGLGLMVIFFVFKPLNLKEQVFVDVPVFELKNFTLYELNNKGLTTLMSGERALKYADRYEVSTIDYTDNSEKYLANMKAKSGIYQKNIVELDGEIVYIREDGLTFKTQKALYYKDKNIVDVPTKYVSYRGQNITTGSSMKYNNISENIESKNVTAKYEMKEKF